MEEGILNPRLIVDVEALDKEHSRLFASLYSIHSAIIDRADYATLTRMFHKLVVDIEEAFGTEENMFGETNYPNASEHTADHEELTVEILKRDWDFMNRKALVDDSTLQLVKQKLASHILTSDKSFGLFYRSARAEQGM